jgi:TolB protein
VQSDRFSRPLRTAAQLAIAALTFVTLALVAVSARPNRYGHSDREERHMLPAVSSGPLDPAWSPDGHWIAFSMRGDIWKVPADGGQAIAVTSGPAYHFEPAWSPDGSKIAFSHQSTGNLEIGIVSADGGAETVVASHPAVDVQPAWTRDGNSLFFTSARAGGWRIFRHEFATNAVTQVVEGIQASVSPDGTRIAYEQRGLYMLDLAPGSKPILVCDEETEYRMEPAWTPDGVNLLYVTEDEGSNDIRIIPAPASGASGPSSAGDPIELTFDVERHEMSPSVSPDGKRFAFVQFEAGVPTLYTADIAGGRASAWKKIPVTARKPVVPTGRVTVRVLGPDGKPMPGRVYVDASDKRHYTPDGAFHRSMMVFDRHYFHTDGESTVDLPAGPARVEALRGFEFTPASVSIDVKAGESHVATLRLERLADPPARGWYSGDGHVHDLHQGFGLTHQAFFRQLVAEDLRVTHALIHMDGTRLMGRWSDLTGKLSPLSTSTHLLQYAQEFRGGLGHVGMIGVREFILPFTAGAGGTAYAQTSLQTIYLEGARRQGGLAGFMHPFSQTPKQPSNAANLIAMDLALGLGDYYDIGALFSDERASADFYYRLLNAGFRIAATGGTDNFSDVWLDPPPGSSRTYARLSGPLTMANWLEAIRRGRTYFTSGPIISRFDVEGRGPGDEIALAADAPPSLRVVADVVSIAPVDSLAVLVNGAVAQTIKATDPQRIAFDGRVDAPAGGWLALRVSGPKSPYIGDDYAFAQTSPVYVVRGGRRFVSAADVAFLADAVRATWARVEKSRWRSPAERDAFRAAVDRALAHYATLAADAR